MTAVDFTVFDLDFPAGSKNKTATLITGEHDVLLVDVGFTCVDGHRLAAAVLDSGKQLTTVFVSHGDPDFYFGAEVLADAFPNARFVATPHVIEHIQHSYEGKLEAWATLGANLLRGVLLFQREHVWVADTSKPEQRAAWIALLDEMAALDPGLVVPGHRLPDSPADASAITATRDYLLAFEDELGNAVDGAALTEALVRRYPDHGMLIAAQIGAKVAKGEMSWDDRLHTDRLRLGSDRCERLTAIEARNVPLRAAAPPSSSRPRWTTRPRTEHRPDRAVSAQRTMASGLRRPGRLRQAAGPGRQARLRGRGLAAARRRRKDVVVSRGRRRGQIQ